jgi:hypothetical protein
MKTKVIILTAVAILFITTGYATKIPEVSVIPVDIKKTLVTFKAEEAKKVDLKIKDDRGSILFHEKFQEPTTDFSKIFSFAGLNKGTFTLCLQYDNCCIYRDLTINGRKISVGNEVKVYEPHHRTKDGKVFLSFFNPSMGKVYVSIYENGERLTRRYLGNQLIVQKCIDLSQLDGAKYDFVLSEKYDEHQFTVNK